jgi:hypothetical protein
VVPGVHPALRALAGFEPETGAAERLGASIVTPDLLEDEADDEPDEPAPPAALDAE